MIGMLAHVDAGKTTLSEAMLYRAGRLRRLGRVDHGDAYLDNNDLERERGITIFSKPARLTVHDLDLTIVDTPGHVDFSAEMEHTLSVLDYALLVVDATSGLEGYIDTLWRLLARYGVPTFMFVNKMDLSGADLQRIIDLGRRRWPQAFLDLIHALNRADMEMWLYLMRVSWRNTSVPAVYRMRVWRSWWPAVVSSPASSGRSFTWTDRTPSGGSGTVYAFAAVW